MTTTPDSPLPLDPLIDRPLPRPALDHLSAVQAALAPEHPPILTVGSLRGLLDMLAAKGIDEDTAVVVANDGWYDEVLADVGHPLTPEPEMIWVTLTLAGPADARFTPGWRPPEPEPPRRQDTPTDVVAWAMDAFWGDEAGSYKAGDYDSCLNAAQALEAAGYAWSDAAVRRAADVSFVMGQHGVDQRTDRQYHAVIAACILETEDV